MKALARNKRPVWYALYTGKTAVTDEDGNKTGEYALTYSTPVSKPMNVSGERKYVSVEPFGIEADYECVLLTDDINCPIDETSAIWIGVNPTVNSPKPTHQVVKVSKTINGIAYTVKEI